MTTALDILQDALENLGVYAAGETLSSADANRGLIRFNDMLDSWSNEALLTFAELVTSKALTPGINQYTIGPGGDIDMPRPIRLLDGPGAAYLMDQNFNRYPVNVVPLSRWNQIWNLQTTTSNLPDTLFYDPQFPLGIINIWPMPNTAGMTMFWTSYLPLADLVNLNADFTMPPGYKLAVTLNLAVFLKPYFQAAQLDPLVAIQAADAKANIKRSNVRPAEANLEFPLQQRTKPWNIYSDTYR